MQERCTSIPAESVYGSVTPNSILLSCILYYILVGVFTRAAAAENATGIYRNWYRLTCYIICVYNRYEVPIIHTWNKHFLCVTWTATSRFPLAHKHVKYNNIRYMVHLCVCTIRRALCSPILHRTLQQLALSPIVAVAALSFLRSSHRVLPSIKGIIRARRLCVLIYIYTYV